MKTCAGKRSWFHLLFPNVQLVERKCRREELNQASVQKKAAANKVYFGRMISTQFWFIYYSRIFFSLPFFSSSKIKTMILMVSFMQTFISVFFLPQIVALNKTKERMRPYHIIHENEDPDIKKIKKVNEDLCAFVQARQLPRLRFPRALACCVRPVSPACISSGAELHAGVALSPEVEDHRSGLHLLPSR